MASEDVVNKLVEEGTSNIRPSTGSVEEDVQKLVFDWEHEIGSNPPHYEIMDPEKFTISVNGRKPLTLKELEEAGGSYNVFLQTSLPEDDQIYKPSEHTAESSMIEFQTAFANTFTVEVVEVYSERPVIVYKFNHYGDMKGPFMKHPPTGERINFYGIGIFKFDEANKMVKAEFFYDRGELLAPLVKGNVNGEGGSQVPSGCPFLSKAAN